MTNRLARSTLALPLSLLLSLLLANGTFASSWGVPSRIAVDRHAGLGWETFVSLGGSAGVVIFGRTNQTDIREVVAARTTDAGTTWSSPTVITKHGSAPSASGHGAFVDVVWLWDGRVWYARSDDGGVNYDSPVELTLSAHERFQPRVARGANGLVLVAWGDLGGIYARISTDGGLTFGNQRQLSHNGLYAQIAIADEQIYLLASGRGLRFRRSIDAGQTWSQAVELTRHSYAETLAADGDDVYVAYEYEGGSGWPLKYRHSDDGGVTWSDARRLIPKGWYGYTPFISVHDGVAQAAFAPCVFNFDICSDVGLVYLTRSADGIHWTEPERVSRLRYYSWPVGIGHLGRTIVLFQEFRPGYAAALYSRADGM